MIKFMVSLMNNLFVSSIRQAILISLAKGIKFHFMPPAKFKHDSSNIFGYEEEDISLFLFVC